MVVLSKTQQQILDYLTIDFLTVKQIALKRRKSIQSVYKIINKLKKKGVIGRGFKINRGLKNQQGVEKSAQKIRLHNIQETIKILKKSKEYDKYIKEVSNKLETKEFTLTLTKDYINIYTTAGMSFYGETIDQAYFKAISFFRRAYIKIENRFDIIIDKEGYLNKRWVRQHIAETNNEIAKKANRDKERLVVHDHEDGKEAIITDNSFNLNELEFVHPTKAQQDAKAVLRHLKDMREHPESMTAAQISTIVKELASGQLNNTLLMGGIMQILKSLIPTPLKEQKTSQKQKTPTYIG